MGKTLLLFSLAVKIGSLDFVLTLQAQP